MTDFALDTVTGEMVYGNGPFGASFAFVVSGPAVVQQVRIRLQTILGEWFMDKTWGIPWFESILVKRPDLNLIGSIIRRNVLDVPDVLRITRLGLDYRAKDRTLLISMDLETNSGQVSLTANLAPIRRL